MSKTYFENFIIAALFTIACIIVASRVQTGAWLDEFCNQVPEDNTVYDGDIEIYDPTIIVELNRVNEDIATGSDTYYLTPENIDFINEEIFEKTEKTLMKCVVFAMLGATELVYSNERYCLLKYRDGFKNRTYRKFYTHVKIPYTEFIDYYPAGFDYGKYKLYYSEYYDSGERSEIAHYIVNHRKKLMEYCESVPTEYFAYVKVKELRHKKVLQSWMMGMGAKSSDPLVFKDGIIYVPNNPDYGIYIFSREQIVTDYRFLIDYYPETNFFMYAIPDADKLLADGSTLIGEDENGRLYSVDTTVKLQIHLFDSDVLHGDFRHSYVSADSLDCVTPAPELYSKDVLINIKPLIMKCFFNI